jgi:hypothetical protein
LYVPDGKIPLKKLAAAENVLMSSVKDSPVIDPGKRNSAGRATPDESEGGEGR